MPSDYILLYNIYLQDVHNYVHVCTMYSTIFCVRLNKCAHLQAYQDVMQIWRYLYMYSTALRDSPPNYGMSVENLYTPPECRVTLEQFLCVQYSCT